MPYLTYERLRCQTDLDISRLISVFQIPEISRFYCIDSRHYFSYVTNTTNVYFYKVYNGPELVGVTHLKKWDNTLSVSIMVLPEFQGSGIGTEILNNIMNNRFGLDYDQIEVSIDERNTSSRTLFEHAGFVAVSRDEELINYAFKRA